MTGALLLLGPYVTRTEWPRRRLTTWGLAFLALASLGKLVVGFPENVLIPHTIGGLGNVCGNVGMVLLGLAALRERRWVGIFSIPWAGSGCWRCRPAASWYWLSAMAQAPRSA